MFERPTPDRRYSVLTCVVGSHTKPGGLMLGKGAEGVDAVVQMKGQAFVDTSNQNGLAVTWVKAEA